MEHYDTALAYPVQSLGVLGNQPDLVIDSLVVHGLGLVHPKKNIIETLGARYGGRVSLTRAYHQALEASITRNFQDNGYIACMCHNTDESFHPTADYHATARAVGGCPIYVSDKPRNHNFKLLNKLFLLDKSVLRAQLPGRPTRDCLFVDPTRDGISLLKIWNVNKCTIMVGVFNCQGAGWCKVAKKTRIHDESPGTLTGSVQATDVDSLS
ncbi:putative galactinol--sucrose galactosyltransferase 2 [Camellia lanceoleosa]|uniref:Galactinol--sucrose galactosyltransferase 2 n=1 Tax=Camellia lanceoleosa TaxID=1840588 RepID=A0ACC0G726_9ERIC|nr:putative galactinol--sucrose galactosyltransferase 2 [Camellia lanceoleosa]